LLRLAAIAAEVSADDIRMDAETTLERLNAGRFFVACLGQFKRGKSSLINALVSTRRSLSQCASSAHQPSEEQHDRDDQQHMDE
jgi:predicted GTPase